jgi:hypothetical protein
MQYSLYAFIPLGLLTATALIAAAISLWPGRRRRDLPSPASVVKKQPQSAEIFQFQPRPKLLPAADASRLRQGTS